MLLKGVARLDAPGRQKSPASVAILEDVFHSLDLHDPADQALWGVLCLVFFFLLRRSEIVATTSSTFQWFALRGNDFSAVDANGVATADPKSAASVCVRMRGSKTNQNGKPVTWMLRRSGHPFLCPVFGALLMCQARTGLPQVIPAAVFLQDNGEPGCVSTARVGQALKVGAAATGEDPSRFSSHSLRSGGATNMYRSGVDALTIQFHGRWASDAFKLYTRLCSESVAEIASRIVSGPRASTVLR